ncbi:LysE family translocator [Denitromonas iodatirespirans]|uniref:LysE family translocator n=1 Tax=Denitromonas iodatirespirans TaxID=2795389 RepID=A0A944H9J5_DENI1|nr:LysE family translocator [Denitromonas iodatirespirans]MBT0963309.1 LysE family translocator [Denitromonas iodatirespirans]
MAFDTWLMFVVVAALAILSPGPAILLAITNGSRGGLRAVALSSLGNILGVAAVAGVSVFGLGALLQTSALLFLVVKLIGAAYLVYLGIKQLRRAAVSLSQAAAVDGPVQRPAAGLFREGALVALTNPKAIAFFTALFPVFLDTGRPLALQFGLMTATFMALSFMSLLAYGALARSAGRWLAEPRRQRAFNRVTGGVFIGLGASLLSLGRGT